MSLATGDLTTLANARLYLSNPPSDQVLSSMILRISRWIQSELNRGLLVPKAYTDQYDGTGTAQLVLSRWPLIGLPTVTISGVSVPLAPQANSVSIPGTPYGFRVPAWDGIPPGDPPVIELSGFRFLYGRQNVVISYTAGYQVTGEAQTIPGTPYQITPITPFGIWATDQGVTYASSGATLTPIASGTPSVGQYVPPNPSASSPILYYQFAAADTSRGVLLNYGFIPAELEQAAIELIGERAAYRSRIGIRSQMLASQESMTFDSSGIPRYILDMIYPYINVLPPPMGASL